MLKSTGTAENQIFFFQLRAHIRSVCILHTNDKARKTNKSHIFVRKKHNFSAE